MPQVKEEEEEVKVLQVKEEEEGLLIRQVKEEEEEGVEIPQVKDEEGEPRFPLVKTEEEAPGRPQIKDEEDIFTCEDRKPLTLKQETADFLQMREEISDNNAVQLGELEAGRKQPIPRLATTAYTAKEPKQRKTVEEKKATKRLQDQKRSQHRINLGAAFTRWRALRDRLGITLDQQLAVLLLDRYEVTTVASTPMKHATKSGLPLPSASSTSSDSPSEHAQDFAVAGVEELEKVPVEGASLQQLDASMTPPGLNASDLDHEEFSDIQNATLVTPPHNSFCSAPRKIPSCCVSVNMAKEHAKPGSCSVVGCTSQHRSLFLPPLSEGLRAQWINFIFEGDAPASTPKKLYVCAHHFTPDCFHNEGQFTSGFAKMLKLKHGSLPTVRDQAANGEAVSTSTATIDVRASRDAACQIDPLETHSVGTQLSWRTLQSHVRSKGVQATVSCKNFGVGTSTTDPFYLSTPVKRPSKRSRLDLDEEREQDSDPLQGTSSVAASEGQDSTYDPSDSVSLTESTVLSDEASTPSHKIQKYIVYESCLLELFAVCPVCMRVCEVKTRKLGTFLSVEQRCPRCEFYRQWKSQPVLGSTPAGNLHLSAAVYLSGASFFQIERVFKAMQLQLFQYDTFRRHARSFVEPAVIHHWKTLQDVMLQRLSQEDKVIVGGDMRAHSPAGHSAKFGSYTMMDLNTNSVVDIQLVQSNEVGGSYHMEKEGLKRSLGLLGARGVTLDCIVTDRHPQIQKFLRESNITHYCDVWHMAKGISKKLDKLSKLKECEKLQKWKKSISNHLYWTAATSTTGPERVAKWTSILNHVQDIHTHEDPLYPVCLHELRLTRDENKWLSAATPAFYKLEKLLINERTLKDVAKLSPYHQTSSLEAFHSVLLQFAPKNVVFPFLGMLCRLYLAAMYYNENANRPQAKTNEGVPLFTVHFPKAMKGECSAKPLKTEPTFRYVAEMMDLIFEEIFKDPAPYTEAVLGIPFQRT
ncbi:uncharacterized protein LOC115387508 isoform X2 [Salarias fasciatus]|uniref:uncharacterized protein LOC115387508 isoform X2 n=1 Tax=Salarias fasciatus TaxID=181472 RepID=UPI0011768130|nr:uncharacterized protein LOC115387508 isoform X2 [Salarias fasciatus]